MSENYAGLLLPEALERLQRAGKNPQVVVTCATRRREHAEGTLRVLRYDARADVLTVARFIDPMESIR